MEVSFVCVRGYHVRAATIGRYRAAAAVPQWLRLIDSAVIVILNVTLAEVVLVFATHGAHLRNSCPDGLDETSHPS